jgi:hypothetical protein
MKANTMRSRDGTAPALPSPKTPFLTRLLSSTIIRFAGWWSIFAGALALNSICPVCGSSACPVGMGTTGIIAGFIAAAKLWGGRFIRFVIDHFRQSHQEDTGNVETDCSCGSFHDHYHHPSVGIKRGN